MNDVSIGIVDECQMKCCSPRTILDVHVDECQMKCCSPRTILGVEVYECQMKCCSPRTILGVEVYECQMKYCSPMVILDEHDDGLPVGQEFHGCLCSVTSLGRLQLSITPERYLRARN